jgi:hypothetical protein
LALGSFGDAATVLIHEYAHDDGRDGTKSHEETQRTLQKALLNYLYTALKEGPDSGAGRSV